MPFKKGDFARTKKHIDKFPKGTLCRVSKGGKNPRFAISYNPSICEVLSVEIPASHVDTMMEPASFTSKFPIFNEIDFSKVKSHEAMSQETLALSGYLVYQGEKIYVDNGGHGGSTFFSGSKLIDDIQRLIKEQVKAKSPNIDDLFVDLEMAVNWSQSDAFGVVDFDEFIAN